MLSSSSKVHFRCCFCSHFRIQSTVFSVALLWREVSTFHVGNSVQMSNMLCKNPKIKLSSIQCLVIVCVGLAKLTILRMCFNKTTKKASYLSVGFIDFKKIMFSRKSLI